MTLKVRKRPSVTLTAPCSLIQEPRRTSSIPVRRRIEQANAPGSSDPLNSIRLKVKINARRGWRLPAAKLPEASPVSRLAVIQVSEDEAWTRVGQKTDISSLIGSYWMLDLTGSLTGSEAPLPRPVRCATLLLKVLGGGGHLMSSLQDFSKPLNDLSKWASLWILQDESKWVALRPQWMQMNSAPLHRFERD